MKAFYRPIELARVAGVSTDTLRHYERLGLIPRTRRSNNGYREYCIETLDRVRVIQSALSIGFTLAELRRIFRIRDGGGIPCREVRELAAAKCDDLELRIREMKQMRSRLKDLLLAWDNKLQITPAQSHARLLEDLQNDSPSHRKTQLRRTIR